LRSKGRMRADGGGMQKRYPTEQLIFARKLRREMTNAEAALWRCLRGSREDGLKFRRQVPIGAYVVDFLCVQHRLIIELDGRPHERHEQKQYDAERDKWLVAQGYKILRFPNEIVTGDGNMVFERIKAAL
jgi:very-short-patch-repair endonuclease